MIRLAIFIISAMASNAAPPMHGLGFPGHMPHFGSMGGHMPHLGGMGGHMPHLGGMGGHMPHLGGMGGHVPHFGGMGGHHVPFEHRPGHGGYFGLPRFTAPAHGEHGLSMPSHPVPAYGEPGVRVGGLGMNQHSYYGGYAGNAIYPVNRGYPSGSHAIPSYHSASHSVPSYLSGPSVRWHGAGPGHAGIPVVDHGTARAIHEIMKGQDSSSSGGDSVQESSNNVVLGIPFSKGQKLTLPGFLIHSGRGGNSGNEESDLLGAHSMQRPSVVFGGVKPVILGHTSNYGTGSYSTKYAISPVLVKELGKRNFIALKGQKLWG